MQVEMLNVGWMTANAALLRTGERGGVIRFPIPAYLVETESERILIDTGLHPSAVADPGDFYNQPEVLGLFAMEQEQSIADQVDLTTITKVVLTHLHWDHTGGLSLLPTRVPVVVQRAEWEAGHDRAALRRNSFFPRDYAGDDRAIELVDGDHDLLGDGRIRLLLTPGHTPGHQSIQIDDLVIGADVAYFADGLDDHRFPVYGDDPDAQRASAERLKALREAGHTVLPGHDPEVLRPGPTSA